MKNFIFKSPLADLHKIYSLLKVLAQEQILQREDLQKITRKLNQIIALESPETPEPGEDTDSELEALHGDSERAD